MTTLDQALEQLRFGADRVTVESYVERAWVRPVQGIDGWHFEEIDLARIDLITHLRSDMLVNDEAMDVVLSLLDQLYALRTRVQRVRAAVEARPEYGTHPLAAILSNL